MTAFILIPRDKSGNVLHRFFFLLKRWKDNLTYLLSKHSLKIHWLLQTREIEVKNNLTIARGEVGRGRWGEGFSGTTIKDTWTKPRGRVEAREGGGLG